jgi:hypothetical protein
MRLESVRDLKAQALSSVLAPMRRTNPRALGIAFAAEPLRVLDAQPRLIALGIAPQPRGDNFKLAVRLQRRGLAESEQLDRIRTLAKGEVEVRYVGRISKRATAPWHRERNRPLLIGGSVGHFSITAGTLGGFVRRPRTTNALILSNNHVLAAENRARRGDAILQPGDLDGGQRRRDTIARLDRFKPLTPRKVNLLDCAVAELLDGLDFDPTLLQGLGRLAGVSGRAPEPGLRVAKVGRTTGLTRGRISAFEIDGLVIDYGRPTGNLRFDDVLEIESTGSRPFSDGGDSGSLIVDPDLKAVAQLFAGSDVGGRADLGVTYATPIDRVLHTLRVDLLF